MKSWFPNALTFLLRPFVQLPVRDVDDWSSGVPIDSKQVSWCTRLKALDGELSRTPSDRLATCQRVLPKSEPLKH
jgi:hypothetical protein